MNRRMIGACAVTLGASMTAAGPALADGELGDLMVYELNGKLITGHYDFDGGTGLVTDPGPTRIYLAEMEPDWEGGGTPGTDEPGIATDNSAPADPDGQNFAFPANARLDVSVPLLPNLEVNAAYWDGTGAVSFGTSPHSLILEDGFGAEIEVDGGTAAPTGTVSPWISGSDGTNHDHLEFLLDALDAEATPGIYLTSMVFSAGDLEPSDPAFFLFGVGLEEPLLDEALEAAEAWVQVNVVPEPTSIATLVGLTGVLMRRRARRW